MSVKDNEKEVTAKQLAKIAKETYDTVDHWSDMGLLPFRRERGRIRKFDRGLCLKIIVNIRKLQNKGYSLASIRDTLASQK